MESKLPILKLSASSVKLYESCPRQYYYRYILKPEIPEVVWDHLILGNFVHETLEFFHNCLKKDANRNFNSLMGFCARKIAVAKDRKGELKFPMTTEVHAEAKRLLADYLKMIKASGLPNVQANEKRFNVNLTDDIVIRGIIDRVDLGLKDNPEIHHIVDYKGLAVDTPIPTPSGWTTMGELSVGDFVLGSDGHPTRVMVKSDIHNRPCYKITLSDWSSVVCDNVHLWSVGYAHDKPDAVVSADTLFSRFNTVKELGTGHQLFIRNHSPLQFPDKKLPHDPYQLGAEIGSGKRTELPPAYLRASEKQRHQLWEGIVNGAEDNKIFYNSGVINILIDLSRTFGLSFDRHAFLANTKAGRLYWSHNGRFGSTNDFRVITNIEKVDSVPTQCISVDAPDSLFICGEGMVLSHNTGKSQYLDEFQLLVYGIDLLEKNPDVDHYAASYLVLKENMKWMTFSFSRTDVEKVKAKIISIARQIREDKTWEPRPQFLCKFCDYNTLCDAAPIGQGGKRTVKSGEIEWS